MSLDGEYNITAINMTIKLGVSINLCKFKTCLIGANEIGDKLVNDGYFSLLPDQLIVNEYLPGQGITDHIDCEPCFEDTVVSISLGSHTTMNFTNKITKEKNTHCITTKECSNIKRYIKVRLDAWYPF